MAMTYPPIRRGRTESTGSPIAGGTAAGYRLVRAGLLLAFTLLLATPAMAGSGRVNNTGTIDITVNLRFPPSPADLTQVQNQITAASQVLWDASEGQLRFGNVTITCGAVNEDLADMWVFAQDGRAGVSYATDGSLLNARGVHVTQFLPSSTGVVMAHEFGHLALGLGDEYDEQNRFGACWGFGPCIETANLTEQNHCLMQQPAGFSQTEFCTTGMHDTVVGEGMPCTAGAAPCTDNCPLFNPTTGRYETTQQTANVNRSCWAHLAATFSFLTAPAGLPAAAPPPGFVNPAFTNNCTSTNTVLMVLDKSGSMGWHPDSDLGEVCANGLDDDGDGSIDETSDCAQPRLSFLKAAARGFLTLSNNKGVRAGIVSFNQTPTLEAGFQDVTNMTLGTLQGRVDGLGAGGNTAIGRALSSSTLLFGAETGANKTAFLISDGVNTEGEDPRTVVPALQAQGIRVFTISTGDASNDSTLSEISGTTGGARVDSRSATTLVGSFVQQWARYFNEGTLIPLLPYATDAQGAFEQEPSQARGASDWIKTPPAIAATDLADLNYNTAGIHSRRLPSNNYFEVLAEKGMKSLTLVLAGDLGDMNGFGVEATLDGPAGPNPTHFDSLSPDPLLKVTRDRFFVLLELADPNPGRWLVQVRSRSGSAPVQTGNLTVIGDNPLTDLFTSLDKHVVLGPAEVVRLGVSPIYFTSLRDVDLEAVLVRPDGTTAPLTLATNFGTGGGEDYVAKISGLTMRGLYEVRVLMRTAPGSKNDPGESIFAPAPSNALPVPPLERTAVEYLFVTSGTIPCPTGHIGDCDGDGVQGESLTADADNDTIPDDLDHDSDNDEVPDARETDHGRPIDSDHDNRPDHQDPDSDNDTIPDALDPTPRGEDDGSAYRLAGSFHVGSAHPLGGLDREADANIYVDLDLAYRVTPRLNLKATVGLAQFTEEIASGQPHPRFFHFSANAQALLPVPSGLNLYLQAGPGLYRPKAGGTDPGFNFGVGGQIPIHSPFKLEFGADLHQVQSDRRARFWTLQLGVLFR